MSDGTAVRAEIEIRCGKCDRLSRVAVMEGPEDRHFRHHKCPNCGADYEITLEVEWFED